VNPRIERLPHRNNRLHSDFLQRILELPIDKLNAIAEVVELEPPPAFSARSKLSRIGKKFLMTSAAAYSAEFLLLTHRALARIIELRLQTRKTIKERVALGLSFSVSDAALSSAALPESRWAQFLRLPPREAPIQIQIHFSLSISLSHTLLLRFIQKFVEQPRDVRHRDMVC